MARASDIIAAFAADLRKPAKDVTEIARRVREAGHFVKETKSLASPRATPRHCANLLMAIMSSEPAKRASRAIAVAERMQWDNHHLPQIESDPIINDQINRWEMRVFRYPSHSLLDGVAALFAFARANPNIFDQSYHMENSYVEIERHQGSAQICLSERSTLIVSDPKPFYGHVNYWDSLNFNNKSSMTITYRVLFRTIRNIGQLLAHDEEGD